METRVTRELEVTRHLSGRLSLALRVYGQRMKRAEAAFNTWLKPESQEAQVVSWVRYKRESDKAGRNALRHHHLAARALGVPRV